MMKQLIRTKYLTAFAVGVHLALSSAQAQTLSDALDNGEAMGLGVGVGGQIAEVLVSPGDRVQKGQILLSLQSERLQAAVDAAQAKFEYLQFKAQLTEEDYARHQELFAEGSFSTVELQMLELGVKQVQSELAHANADLVTARQNLAAAKIVAPIDGRIVAVPVVGQRVSIEGGVPVLIKIRQP